jgi:hypothetical protein
MTAGSFLVMPMVAQILPGFEFAPEEPLDYLIDSSLDSDNSLDILFGKESLGTGAHSPGDNGVDAHLGKIDGEKAGLVSGVRDFRTLNDPAILDFDKSVVRTASKMSGYKPAFG